MAVESQTPDPQTVRLVVEVPRPPAEVYLDFTDGAALSTWFWPERLQPSYDVAAVEGGTLRVHSEIGDFGVLATFTELVPNRRVALDWRWDGSDVTSVVEVDLSDEGGRTRVTVTHSGNPDERARDEHRDGWTDCLTRLERNG